MRKKLSDYGLLLRLSEVMDVTGLGRPGVDALRQQHPDLCVVNGKQRRYLRIKLQQICGDDG